MTYADAKQLADTFREIVLKRTGLTRQTLSCPREQSTMTPCVARDGGLAVVLDRAGRPLCVGCESNVSDLMELELRLMPVGQDDA